MFGNRHCKSDNLSFRTSVLGCEDFYLFLIIVTILGNTAFDWSYDYY